MPTQAQKRLKTLDSVKGFGLFRDFEWNQAALEDFERFNLIYGWNYSGKTTLSRVFQTIEDQRVHSDFIGATFQFTKGDGTTVSSTLVGDLPAIRVFNREFVQRNFRVGTDMTGATVIAVLGEENLSLKDRLAQLQSRAEKVRNVRSRLQQSKDGVQDAIDSGATDQARIVNAIVVGPFTRVHLNQLIDALPSDHTPLPFTDVRLEEEKEQYRRAQDFCEVVPYSSDNRSVVGIILGIRSALKQVATNTALQALRNNRDLELWVESGLKINTANTPCGFCGARVTGDRWSELKGHFSEAFSALQARLQSYEATIAEVMVDAPIISETSLFPELREAFRAALQNLGIRLDDAEQAAISIRKIVRAKLANLESSTDWQPKLSIATDLRTAIFDFNAVIRQHNEKVAAASDVRAQAKSALCQHFGVEYLRDCNVRQKKERIEGLTAKVLRCTTTISRIENQITATMEAIKRASIAERRINENLAILIPGDNIEAVRLNDTDFEFQRNGQAAKNMSEGERTAVALCYFLAKLEEGSTSIEDSIVLLDDPISSLDSNHIYAVHSIIENRLGKANQLFVLTHNSTFFGLTKDWMKKKNGRFYMARRIKDASQAWHAELVRLPRLLKKFKSDYQYTYYCLKLLHDEPAPELEHLCGVPNMIRRLLEAYLGFVFPESGSWGEKLPKIIDCEVTCRKIRKFADENSHSHSLAQATEVPDYVAHCKEVIGDVLLALHAHNPTHIDSLEAELLAEAANLP